jgi:hypothetical protein
MISENFLIQRIQKPIPAGTPIVPVSLPVTSFGDPNQARIATIGINPSSGEFCSKGNTPLKPGKKRFVDREDIGLGVGETPSREQALRVLEGNHNYFRTENVYKWFNPMQQWVLDPLQASYGEGSAVHLDLVQWATNPIWNKISDPAVREALVSEDSNFLSGLIHGGEFELIILNGATVTNTFIARRLFLVSFEEKKTFLKANGKQTSVTFRVGAILGTPTISWSANIPSSQCGNITRSVVSQWISEAIHDTQNSIALKESFQVNTVINVCPICGKGQMKFRRYPRYLCASCVDRAVDGDGRNVSFTDHDNGDGLTMRYIDKASPDIHTDLPAATGYPHVWVDGVECEVRVAHFGGVVFQTLDWREFMDSSPQ